MTDLRPQRHEPFIAKLEQAIERGEPDFVERNLPRLEQIIAELMDAQHRLADLQYRASPVRDRHERAGSKGKAE